ncbi:MAG TPA: hypothetical protein VFB38_08935 [Chthonomonadaceae bacterium]|nr:hypothetical protein [Chthonomonadaceae bacterium]
MFHTDQIDQPNLPTIMPLLTEPAHAIVADLQGQRQAQLTASCADGTVIACGAQ